MPDRGMAALVHSIDQFGLVQPVVVHRSTRRVIGGNQRVEALKRLGTGQVLVCWWHGPVEAARTRAYEAVSKIDFENCHYRRDIALSALGGNIVRN